MQGGPADATVRRARAGSAEDPADLSGSSGGEHWAVMASNIRVEARRVTGSAGGDRRAGNAGRTRELERGIRAGNTCIAVGAGVVDEGIDVILRRSVVIDLA